MDKRQLEIRVEREDHIAVVTPMGAVDASNLDDFKEALDTACGHEHARVIVDCDELSYVNSTSFGLLFHYHRACESRRGHFVLCSVREKIRGIIQMLGLQDVLRIYGTRAEAMEALHGV